MRVRCSGQSPGRNGSTERQQLGPAGRRGRCPDALLPSAGRPLRPASGPTWSMARSRSPVFPRSSLHRWISAHPRLDLRTLFPGCSQTPAPPPCPARGLRPLSADTRGTGSHVGGGGVGVGKGGWSDPWALYHPRTTHFFSGAEREQGSMNPGGGAKDPLKYNEENGERVGMHRKGTLIF